MTTQETTPKVDRRTRRRVVSRAKLIAAAHRLIIDLGIDAISIQDITEAADVGLGTFYNHFDSKAAILLGVAQDIFTTHTARVDEMRQGIEDPAELVSISYRAVMHHAQQPDNWGIIRQLPVDAVRALVSERVTRDIEMGLETGRFAVDNSASLTSFICGVGLSVMGDLANEVISLEDAEHTTVYFLQMLGISRDEALALASKPLPL